ncbi:MAG: ATP-dependent helicase [Bacteroidia bacterium]|nr:ATP-dependent helicase [Bacteroidia bacterium]
MKLTSEQEAIISSIGNIKINAVAGSGKTTTVIEYAKTRPINSKILYLAFNRSVKIEAEKKFAEKGLRNVNIETAHSLAYKKMVFRNNYKVRSQDYKTHELVELLGLTGPEKHAEFIIANHINKFVAYFCNSNKQKVQELNYLDVVTDSKAKAFVKTFYTYIQDQARILLSKMNKGEIEITHDFYLKKFQLSNPKLNYDYILFDEGQDASPAMLDIFLKQDATKIIVGDTHQQIYGWRYAVNSLEQLQFPVFHLSTSFRFSSDIASLATEILEWKGHFKEHKTVIITGKGSHKEFKSKAVIARTNLGLLLKAIEYATEKKKIKHIYFEGNINSYTYADEGTSLYDVLNLYERKTHLIRDKMVKAMKNFDELEDYIKKTDDVQLGMMVEIVKKYGNRIPGIIKTIKEKHIGDDEKHKAQMIFSTVHRCKGMEYDAIQLANDFITEEKLEKLKFDSKEKELNKDKLNEEINLLYVAITRTKNSIHIPKTLLPGDFPPSQQIYILKDEPEEPKHQTTTGKSVTGKNTESIRKTMVRNNDQKEKAYSVAKLREKHKGAYMPWLVEHDDKLTELYCEGTTIKDIALHFGRTRGAIRSRIKKLELEDKYG